MFLGRSESIKWIRKKFSKRHTHRTTCNSMRLEPESFQTLDDNCFGKNNNKHNNLRDLNEIFIVNNNNNNNNSISHSFTPTPITDDDSSNKHSVKMFNNYNNEVMTTTGNHAQSAPIAQAELTELDEKKQITTRTNDNEDMNSLSQVGVSSTKRPIITNISQITWSVANNCKEGGDGGNSKSSLVHNYWKKCKDFWMTGGTNNQLDDKLKCVTTTTTIPTTTEHTTSNRCNRINHSHIVTTTTTTTTTTTDPTPIPIICCKALRLSSLNEELEEIYEDGSYEDIDFGLHSLTAAAATSTALAEATTPNTYVTLVNGNESVEQLSSEIESTLQQQEKQCENVLQPQAPIHKHCNENDIEILTKICNIHDMECFELAALIDRHLANIYPVFLPSTRAVLIREARNVLNNTYHGCLVKFENLFLHKFAEIANILLKRHYIGVALLWCQGWPLVTPIGEVVLHLGDLEDDQVKLSEIYLCVKTETTDKEPQLYAIWRTPLDFATELENVTTATHTAEATLSVNVAKATTPQSTLKCCQLDYHDHTLYLSMMGLEMLNEELPQLLQSLLVGVEESVGRLMFNELQPNATSSSFGQIGGTTHHSTSFLPSTAGSATKAVAHNNNDINVDVNGLPTRTLQAPVSPKCLLKRSELITRNKLPNNKLLMRRLTNRQDSMNSTSSGNSSGSGISTTSSDSGSYGRSHQRHQHHHQQQQQQHYNSKRKDSQKTETATTATISEPNSPALPRFCLGNKFPHIDSDEESVHDHVRKDDDNYNNNNNKNNKINTNYCHSKDCLESEILLTNSIADIPEKLLLAGINLPGTHDFRGSPLITIDAASVLLNDLKCHEIATVLLFYINITESSNKSCTNGGTVGTPSHQRLQQQPKTSLSTSATTVTCLDDNQVKHHQTPNDTQRHHSALPPPLTFTILIGIEYSQQLCVIDLISQSLKLLKRHHVLLSTEIFVVIIGNRNNDTSLLLEQLNAETEEKGRDEEREPNVSSSLLYHIKIDELNANYHNDEKLKFISVNEVAKSIAPQLQRTPSGRFKGLCSHNAQKWREFFIQYEPFYEQCTRVAQGLVVALNDIRNTDLQGLPTRRQLYTQHRALSRTLMDSDLHTLRKRGDAALARLRELANHMNNGIMETITETAATTVTSNLKYTKSSDDTVNNNGSVGIVGSKTMAGEGIDSSSNTFQRDSFISQNNAEEMATKSTTTTSSTCAFSSASTKATNLSNNSNIMPSAAIFLNPQTTFNANAISGRINNKNIIIHSSANSNLDVAIRLQKVTLLFNEIDRAAKRMEQLTEQRRERLREFTRQQALHDEINEVTAWLNSVGSETLQRFINLQLAWETPIKEHEQEFEKFYFISMKYLAKGRDLHAAAFKIKTLSESALSLKTALDCFAAKLEMARERIERTLRLHYLLNTTNRDDSQQMEMETLAEEYGVKGIIERYREQLQDTANSLKLNSLSINLQDPLSTCKSLPVNSTTAESTPVDDTRHKDDVGNSFCSSSLGGYYETSEGLGRGVRTCHCWPDSRNLYNMEGDDEEGQSKMADSGLGGCNHCEGHSKAARLCSCSCQCLNETHNLYDKHDDLDDDYFGRPSKHYLDMHSPLEANTHLHSFASDFELPKIEELSCLEPKIQKTILLIMREMIGTERDYVRSLYYVIENYVDELLRSDIPQPLRGQRNVIFGNIEKIFEFHNNHFLTELERYECNPLKVGAAFLQMESKFYLYALYNKNKPKSDTLMSEYGTTFFKSKQRELDDKMDLASYLLKPVQRMGKYALLLQQLVKACSTVQGVALQDITADVEELQKAEEMVKFQLRHGNDLLAMDSLRECDVNVKEQGRLLRQNEFLVWQGKGGKKSLRQVFLFEELVLFSKARRFPDKKNLDIYIYKSSIKTADIGLTPHIEDSSTKFEIWFRKRKREDTYTLQCMSDDIKNAWIEEISKLLWQQAKRNREIRLAEMSSMGIGSKPCLDIRPSNNQINDRSITINQLSKAPKLRHSFVSLKSDQMKTARRPNSLVSESSLSSGASSSSLSKSSNASSTTPPYYHHHTGLELINETQTLKLSNNMNQMNTQPCQNSLMNNNEMLATTQQQQKQNNHKRSDTNVDQPSVGIDLELSYYF